MRTTATMMSKADFWNGVSEKFEEICADSPPELRRLADEAFSRIRRFQQNIHDAQGEQEVYTALFSLQSRLKAAGSDMAASVANILFLMHRCA